MGICPWPGDTDEFEWTGYIPFDKLPQALNPRGGIIATANARTVGPAYKYFISDRWAGPYRTDRIYELLGARKDLRPADANSVQNDIVSWPDKFLAQQLYAAGQKVQPKDSRTKTLIYELKDWDGKAVGGFGADFVSGILAARVDGDAAAAIHRRPDGELRIVGARERVRQRLVAG